MGPMKVKVRAHAGVGVGGGDGHWNRRIALVNPYSHFKAQPIQQLREGSSVLLGSSLVPFSYALKQRQSSAMINSNGFEGGFLTFCILPPLLTSCVTLDKLLIYTIASVSSSIT